MYEGKSEKFDALCSHLDEVEKIPFDSKVLSFNDHSKIQALSFKINGASFWGTQYHPEFLSKPGKPEPIYKNFIKAIIENRSSNKK